MIASLASVASSTSTANPYAGPIRAATLLPTGYGNPLGRPCDRSALPCVSFRTALAASDVMPAAHSYADPTVRQPRKTDGSRTLGGFVHLDILTDPQLRTGPEFSWSSPDSPREDLQKMRLISPGWGLRYFLAGAPLAVGVSACSRIVMMGKQLPLVDPLTSEARVEFQLP
jgi:hypothetical protein